MKRLWPLILMLVLLSACAAPAASQPAAAPALISPTEIPTAAASPTAVLPPTPGSTPAPEAQPSPPTPTITLVPTLPPAPEPRTRYQLEASLDYAAHSLSVEEQITYTNTTPDRLEALVFAVGARRYPGVFQLARIEKADGERIFHFIWKDTMLSVPLDPALEPGESIQLTLSYSLQLLDVAKQAQIRQYPLGYTSLQANFGDWYPFIPPYQSGTGWLAHPPSAYGEHLVYDIADFEVAIRQQGAQTGLILAAGALPEMDGEWTRYQHTAARSFAWSASPYYDVITQTVQIPSGGQALLSSYAFAFHAKASQAVLTALAQAVELYSRLYGAFPRPALTAVQVEFLDGMEYDGLFFLSSDFYNWHKDEPQDFLLALTAHETAHMWWYGLVGNDQALHPWLDEALCTYSERLFYEAYYPQALAWWWAYRVNYYEPEGWVDIQVYDVPGPDSQYRLYRDPVYLRGALFMEELRLLVGDPAFFAALRSYLQAHAYRQATPPDFFAAVRAHSAADLQPLLERYFKDVDALR